MVLLIPFWCTESTCQNMSNIDPGVSSFEYKFTKNKADEFPNTKEFQLQFQHQLQLFQQRWMICIFIICSSNCVLQTLFCRHCSMVSSSSQQIPCSSPAIACALKRDISIRFTFQWMICIFIICSSKCSANFVLQTPQYVRILNRCRAPHPSLLIL